VTGLEARAWLNGLLTCNVESVTPTQGVWGLLLNKRGKIVCDLTIVADETSLWLGTAYDTQALFELLDSYLVMEDAELEIGSGWTWLTLHGPGALTATEARADRAQARAAVAWSREEGAALVVSEDALASTLNQLTADSGARLVTDAEWSALRINAGLPTFDVDFGSDDNPHEAGLDRRTVDWTKGCYLGQEVVCMQDMRGKVKRRLARLQVDDVRPLSVGEQVTDRTGVEIGRVTSAAPAPEPGQAAAIARLRAPFFEPGSTVLVSERQATVLELLPESP
jgi:folate-binding protein YgfZ